jgi:Tripartite tricarboxylate transporter TctB family
VPQVRRALRDILAGSIFVVIGALFALGSLAYDFGTPLAMGPGYVPLVLALILSGLGLLVVAKGFIAGSGEPIGEVDWRAVILITAALLFFGLTIRGLGVIGALFGSTVVAAFARKATSPREALLFGVGLTGISVLIFVVALQLRLPLVGNWIPL